jgi:hypothetical protein
LTPKTVTSLSDFKIGQQYNFFWNDGNPNNKILHLRGIVDSDVYVFCYWRKSKKYWNYKIESAGFLSMLIKDKIITYNGKSNIKLWEES